MLKQNEAILVTYRRKRQRTQNSEPSPHGAPSRKTYRLSGIFAPTRAVRPRRLHNIITTRAYRPDARDGNEEANQKKSVTSLIYRAAVAARAQHPYCVSVCVCVCVLARVIQVPIRRVYTHTHTHIHMRTR